MNSTVEHTGGAFVIISKGSKGLLGVLARKFFSRDTTEEG